MTLEHRDLNTADVHEPKHISDTTAADSGKVITPSTGGNSVLRYLAPADVGLDFYYLEWTVAENTTLLSLTAAVDSTLYTGTDYTQLNVVNLPGAVENEAFGMSFGATDYEVTIPVTGTYRITFWTNMFVDTASTKIGFRLFVDGTPVGSTAKRTFTNIGNVGHLSVDALQTFTAGQSIGIGIASDKTIDATIEDLKANITLVKEA